jgi:hypothetical protein
MIAFTTISGSHTFAAPGFFTVVVTPDPGSAGFGGVFDFVVGTPNQVYLAEVYHDLLNRQIDMTGLQAWSGLLDQGVSGTEVVQQIENTTEFRIHEVTALYSQYLKRAPDPMGLAGSVAFLQQGGTQEQLAAMLILSPEYALRAGSTDAQFLNTVYMDTFHRSIDQKGLSDAQTFLAAGGTRQVLINNIFTSDEYIGDLVRGYYTKFLNRDPELDPGFIAWTNYLKQGHTDESEVAMMLGMLEFFSQEIGTAAV